MERFRLALRGLVCVASLVGGAVSLSAKVGADLPWTTIEAETMRTTGRVLRPTYAPHRVETESSAQKCVQLNGAGEYVEFTAPMDADSLVLRYHLPDSAGGGGTNSQVTLMVGDREVRTLSLTSRNAWLYGAYPFSNDPSQGKPRNFYDELRVDALTIAKGQRMRLQKSADDGIACTLDLIDLEAVPAPDIRPHASVSLMDFGTEAQRQEDATDALRQAIAAVAGRGGVVWVPPGSYRITGDIVVPSGVTVQGSGMWHTRFIGDARVYDQADRRVRFKMTGKGVHLADFSILGELNYRNDNEANDGVVVDRCEDGSVKRLWIEHTKAGVWVYNGVNLTIEGCRFRNLLADGVNFCVGTSHSVVENCTARGTGDDCFAIWPVASDQGRDERAEKPGHNVIRRSTGQLTFLANGGALYGGASNRIEDCLFTDISTGCGILISTTFPTSDPERKVDNNFSGETVVRDCQLVRCGGSDHSWSWRGAFQLCLDRRSLSGIRVSNVEIRDSFSDGLTVVAPGAAKGEGTLSNTGIEGLSVAGIGLGVDGRHAIRIRGDALGELTLVKSEIADIHNESPSFRVTSSSD